MRYNIVIAICFITVAGFLIFARIQEKDENLVFFEKYKYVDAGLLKTEKKTEDIAKWTFQIRLDNYYKNLDSLKGAILNIIILVVLGLLLIFYRPDGINVPFIALKIPAGILYIVIIFGALYAWSNFGLELNSAIDSRLALHNNLIALTGAEKYEHLPYDLKPTHILVDNAMVDGWVGYYFNIFKADGLTEVPEWILKTWEILGLFGLYGTLSGVLIAISFITPIEFGERKREANGFAKILLGFTLMLILIPNVIWGVFLHKYATNYLAYVWVIVGASVVFWKVKGIAIAERLSNKKS
jgi:hypothetical protein